MNKEQFDILGLSKEQLIVMKKALELYERLSLGQISYVGESIMDLHYKNMVTKISVPQLCDLFKPFHNIIGLKGDEHFGVGNNKQHQNGKIAYDLFCVIRKKIAEVDNHDSYTVDHDEPMNYSNTILPTIK